MVSRGRVPRRRPGVPAPILSGRMRQLLQNVATGDITVEDVPAPSATPVSLLVETRFSLISAGTERSALDLGRSSLAGKARARPDLVQKVVESARTEGLASTYAKVRGRLGEPNALGYSLSGVVLESCADGPAAPGDLVACAGAGRASHAEIVTVSRNLCARVPDGVRAEDAAYGTVAAIALHGVHLAEVGLGDVVAIIGLGLVGQLTVEILMAAGCQPLGMDPDSHRVTLAREIGAWATTDAAELDAECRRVTAGRGADGVLITAASKSAAPLATATAVARERAVICVVGDVAIESPRAPLFSKELRLVVSRSYGPGRYDPSYEDGGTDYPAGYVRWTEGRNLEEVLRLMATGKLCPARLTTHTVDLEDGERAYALLDGEEPSLGILLRYAEEPDRSSQVRLTASRRAGPRRHRSAIGVIGAGAFARGVLMPRLARHADIVAVATATGLSAHSSARRFGASLATTDVAAVLESPDVDAVVIATRHDTHAEYVVRALKAGKDVFTEKPLALDEQELARVERAAAESDGILMVGFNRRFAPLAGELRRGLADHGPLVIEYRVNAGRLPRSHWTHDPSVGGGRIVGEGCHFVDFAAYLAGGRPVHTQATAVSGGSEPREDNVIATFSLSDGSVASLVYAAFGDPALPKERVEVMGERGAAILDDFAQLHLFTQGTQRTVRGKRDKGHAAEVDQFLSACRTGQQPWPLEDMLAVTRATFAIRDAVHASGAS